MTDWRGGGGGGGRGGGAAVCICKHVSPSRPFA